MSSNKSTKDALKAYDNLLVWTSVLLTVVLVLVHFFADKIFTSSTTINFIENLTIEFIPIGVAFIVSYLVFRKVQQLKEKQSISELSESVSQEIIPAIETMLNATPAHGYNLVDFNKIPWDELLQGAMRVDIMVHYFDTWIRNNDDFLEAVFRRSGTIRLIIPNFNNYNLVQSIKQRFPEYSYNHVKDKIENTKNKLDLIIQRAGAGNLEVYQTEERVYYCGIRIDEKVIVLSNYDHIRDKMKIEAPTFLFEISKQPGINDWFQKELEGLIASRTNL